MYVLYLKTSTLYAILLHVKYLFNFIFKKFSLNGSKALNRVAQNAISVLLCFACKSTSRDLEKGTCPYLLANVFKLQSIFTLVIHGQRQKLNKKEWSNFIHKKINHYIWVSFDFNDRVFMLSKIKRTQTLKHSQSNNLHEH